MTTRVLCLVGIALMLFAIRIRPDDADDFRLFYRAGALSASHQSPYSHPNYFPDKNADVKFLPFIRIPTFAWILRALAALPYSIARAIWIGLLAIAFLGCVWLFPFGRDRLGLAMSFSFPLAYAMVLGQDIGFVLLFALAAIRLISARRDFAAGLVASLMAIKFSYLPAVGLVFLLKSRRGCRGLALGLAIQGILCFAAGGLGWPWELLAMLQDAEPRRMPNIRSVAIGVGLPNTAVALICVALFICLGFVCRRLSAEEGIITALPVVLILLPHCYIYDAVLLIPLLIMTSSMKSWDGMVALAGVTPIPYFLLLSPMPIQVWLGSVFIVMSTLTAAVRMYRLHADRKTNAPGYPEASAAYLVDFS